MKELVELFWLFAQIGVCTFGGGYAMLPLLQREISDTSLAVQQELPDGIGIVLRRL